MEENEIDVLARATSQETDLQDLEIRASNIIEVVLIAVLLIWSTIMTVWVCCLQERVDMHDQCLTTIVTDFIEYD